MSSGARGLFRHLPWKEQPHVLQNPRFPHARGFPRLTRMDEPHRFKVGDRVKPASLWIAERIGGFNTTVISTCRRQEFRRDVPVMSVMVAELPGRWFHVNHFVPEPKWSTIS